MICIDTNILLWGLDRELTPGIEHLVELAERFFAHVSKEKIQVIVPTQVLAEFLVRNTNDERQEALTLIEESFPIAPLDFEASMIAAELTSNRNHTDEVRATFGLKRHCYKADINIIASALAYGATTLVTGNWKEIRALAQGRIVVKSLEEYMERVQSPLPPVEPDRSNQKSLFDAKQDDDDIDSDRPLFAQMCDNGAQSNGTPWIFARRLTPHPMQRRIILAPPVRLYRH